MAGEPYQNIRILVGAVGIENNAEWNFKDLEEMARNAKTLRKNNKEQKEILIGPSMAPRFFDSEGFPQSVSGNNLKCESASVQIRGADGKPTFAAQIIYTNARLKFAFYSSTKRSNRTAAGFANEANPDIAQSFFAYLSFSL